MITQLMIAVFILPAQTSPAHATESQPQQGLWRAWLDSPGGELPFGLELGLEGERWHGSVVNGEEHLQIPQVSVSGRAIVLGFDHYDSRIEAKLDHTGTRMDGTWTMRRPGDKKTEMHFHARFGTDYRFKPHNSFEKEARIPPVVSGRWAVRFSKSDEPAIAIFESDQDTQTVRGTFMTTTGDYRYLAGAVIDSRLKLSCFDGAHAFLFHASVLSDSIFGGNFWSRDSWHETWTARRDPQAKLPDAFTQTICNDKIDLAALRFPDLDGKLRSLADPQFAGKARIIEVFGTWCPNCNDAVKYLVELHKKYKDRGLSIVGLAFEHTGKFERDARQVRKFAKRYAVEYPLLLAGLSDKKTASKAFPLLDRVRSFPTTIFLHADGRVRAVHTGYTGPATGPAYDHLRAKFESLIEELLAESSKSE